TANMVIEHVKTPIRLFSEVGRVLTAGGRFIIHTPNATGYTTTLTRMIPARLRAPLAKRLMDRDTADVYATYYRANTPAALQRMAEVGGLKIEALRWVHSSPQLLRVPPLMVAE